MKEPRITVGQDILQLIAEIDEFKGQLRIPLKMNTDSGRS